MEAKTVEAKPDTRKPNPNHPEMVLLLAINDGFWDGALREKGKEFMFTGKRIPRWAEVVGTPEAVLKAEPVAGDTRPKAAREAAERKAKGIQEQTQG